MKNSKQQPKKQALQAFKSKASAKHQNKPVFIAVAAVALLAISTIVVNSDARNFIFGSFARTKYVCVKEDKKVPKCTGTSIAVWNQSKCAYKCQRDDGSGDVTWGNTQRCKEGPSLNSIVCDCSRQFNYYFDSTNPGYYNYEVAKCAGTPNYKDAGRYGPGVTSLNTPPTTPTVPSGIHARCKGGLSSGYIVCDCSLSRTAALTGKTYLNNDVQKCILDGSYNSSGRY